MNFRDTSSNITWRLHLRASPREVFEMWATEEGRARFWAETAAETDGCIDFSFPNGLKWRAKILNKSAYRQLQIVYIDNSITTIDLAEDGHGGTELLLTDTGVATDARTEVIAGWVSVLMSLKGAVDFGVDLRNHDPLRTWDQGYVES